MVTRRTKMATLTSSIVILTTLVLLGLYLCVYVPFQPLVFQGDKLVPDPALMTNSFRENIVITLVYYNESFKVDSTGNVFIRRIRWLDHNTMWTYSNQANNPEIIENHKTWLLEIFCPKKTRDCSFLEIQNN